MGEEADGGVEGDRLQDIFCKLFQVRKRLKTLVRTSQVSDCIQFSCILRGVALFLFALINHGGTRKVTRFDYFKDLQVHHPKLLCHIASYIYCSCNI